MKVPTIILIVPCVLGVHGHGNHTEIVRPPQPSNDPSHADCSFGVKEGALNGECRISNRDGGLAIAVGVLVLVLVVLGIVFIIYRCLKHRNKQGSGSGIDPETPPPYDA